MAGSYNGWVDALFCRLADRWLDSWEGSLSVEWVGKYAMPNEQLLKTCNTLYKMVMRLLMSLVVILMSCSPRDQRSHWGHPRWR